MVTELLDAVRTPERHAETHEATTPELVRLAAGASIGIGMWGAGIHLYDGWAEALRGGLHTLLIAGGAWVLTIPALIVLSALAGSEIQPRRLVHLSLMTVCFGGMAFAASLPPAQLVGMAFGHDIAIRWLFSSTNILGVGACAALVFFRLVVAEERLHALHVAWMSAFGLLFVELAILTDLFRFGGA